MDKLKERLRHTTSTITNRFSSADSSSKEEAATTVTKETEVAPLALTKETDESETPTDKKANM